MSCAASATITNPVDDDAPPGVAARAADDGKPAAVPERRRDAFVQDCSVGDPVDTTGYDFANAVGDVRPAPDDPVGTESADQ